MVSLKTLATGAAALCAALSATANAAAGGTAAALPFPAPVPLPPPIALETLHSQFVEPPDSSRPWAFWVWQNGNITREGITADLEAMRRVGMSGALIMEIGYQNIPPRGPVDFMNAEWQQLFAHTLREAKRLGMQIHLFGSAAFGGTGGNWITPELNMQKLTFSEVTVELPAASSPAAQKELTVKLPQPPVTLGHYRDIAVLAFPTPAGAAKRKPTTFPGHPVFAQHGNPQISTKNPVVRREDIRDLTAFFDAASGVLKWKQGAGSGKQGESAKRQTYTILRIGHTATGTPLLPPPLACKDALECDKLSAAAAAFTYRQQIGKLAADNRSLAGRARTFTGLQIDSWEVGSQNWTPAMRSEFARIKNYDILPFLPVFFGFQIDSPDTTRRFLWDFRTAISKMLIQNFAGTINRLADADDLDLAIEAYDQAPADFLEFGGAAHQPVGEFWTNNRCLQTDMRGMASAAHIYGRPLVPAEAFTAFPNDRWATHPATYKPIGDRAFCEGANHFLFSTFSHQPRPEMPAPGVMYYQWGTHYERIQPWWEKIKPWHDYVARCQHLLRQGEPVADIAYLAPEDAPVHFKNYPRDGYLWDHINTHALTAATVNADRQIVLPSGMRYHILALPWVHEKITPELAATLERLVAAGARVGAHAKPPLRAHGLLDPDTERRLADRMRTLWASGKIATGTFAQKMLADAAIPPDFAATGAGNAPANPALDGKDLLKNGNLSFTHRRIKLKCAAGATGGTGAAGAAGEAGKSCAAHLWADVYFVANPHPTAAAGTLTFRATGTPELWHPETGARRPLAHTTAADQKTTSLNLRLGPTESAFIIFTAQRERGDSAAEQGQRDKGKGQRAESAPPPQETTLIPLPSSLIPSPRSLRSIPLTAPWQLTFPSRPPLTLPALRCWTTFDDPEIRHFAGTAVYRTSIPASQLSTPDTPDTRAILDLGRAHEIIEVFINDVPAGTIWKAEKRLDITDALRAALSPNSKLKTPNSKQITLELRVTNLLQNRLIGDAALPEGADTRRAKNGVLLAWPKWFYDFSAKPDLGSRRTFGTWNLHSPKDPLLPSGLLGPVKIEFVPAQQ
ncbi:MAG: hypothetical protein LBR07_03835 [Puniceicoccales bacterium]|jgi:hypothetical protein|nr:hypothetical protein [Puniceicoccales bacterium]